MRTLKLVFVALLLSAGAAPVRAQSQAPAPAADATQALRGRVQTLPEQSAPPRTLRAYWHVFAAFTFAWLMILGYAVSLARRFRRLEEKLDSHRDTEAQR